MKLTIDSSSLADAVAWAQKSIPARPTNPVLGGVMISALSGGEIVLSGYDEKSSSMATVAAYVESPGTHLLPASSFAGIIKSLPRSKDVTIEVTDRATITCGTAKFTTQLIPQHDYPTLPVVPPRVGSVKGEVFSKASSQVSFAASNDPSIPQLTAVHLTLAERMTMVATDRYRMTYHTADWAAGSEEGLALSVPADIVDNVARLNAGEIEIFADERRVGFKCGNRLTTTSTVAGDYPKILPLFPDNVASTSVVAVAELLQVLGRASGITAQNSPVRLVFAENELTVFSGSSADTAGQETISAESDLSDKEIVVGFNVHFLIDALKTLTTEKVEFGVQVNTGKPIVIRELGAFDAKQLVMPVRLP